MSVTPRDYADPFLEQAREDLRAAWALRAAGCPSTLCMLLQMVYEKLAKAAFARQGQVVPKSHQAATVLWQMLIRSRQGRSLVRSAPQVGQYVEELELAQPSIAKKQAQPFAQLEYPWEDPLGTTVRYPAAHLPLARRIANPRDRIGLDCLKFAQALSNSFNQLFP